MSLVHFQKELYFLRNNSAILTNWKHYLKCRGKKKITGNHGHNNFELLNILEKIGFSTSKAVLLDIGVASRVAKRLKSYDLRKLGKMRKKSKLGGDIA